MLTTKNSFLIVVDLQESLLNAMHEKGNLLRGVHAMIKGAQILGLPVLATEQAPEKLGKTHFEVAQLLGDLKPIPKLSFSCLGEEKFKHALLKLKRTHAILIGIETHVCVYQTAADLIKEKFMVQVVIDAVSSRTAENKAVGLERVRQEGGQWTSVETALCELLKSAQAKEFKEILQLIK